MSQRVYYLVECDKPYIGPTICETELEAKLYMAFTDRRGGCEGSHKIVEAVGPDWDTIDQQRAAEKAERLDDL